MSLDAQRQIRENTLELNEFLKDLKGWEHIVKEREKKLLNRGAPESGGNPEYGTPRRNGQSTPEPAVDEVQTRSSQKAEIKRAPGKSEDGKSGAETEQGNKGNSEKTPASHTYDRSQKKWDKFDVDAALKELDEGDEDEQPVKKVSKREVLPPRGSQSKIGTSRHNGGSNEIATGSSAFPLAGNIDNQRREAMAGPGRFSRSFTFDDPPPDATSEKDTGNEYFKEGKYVKAIDSYTRSILLEPTAVAYANRAMAAIKIRRFQDAEVDCSEAISLDDRYTKAYARRGAARKELKKYYAALEDIEFALRLEPDNKELKKQCTEIEELYQKEREGDKYLQQLDQLGVTRKAVESVSRPQQQPTLGKSAMKVDSVSRQQQITPQARKDNIPVEQNNFDSGKPSAETFAVKTPSSSARSKSSTDAKSKANSKDSSDAASPIAAKIKPSELPAVAKSSNAKSELPENQKAAGDSLTRGKSSVRDAIPITAVPQKQGAKIKDKKMAEVVAATQAAAARAAASAMEAVSRNIVAPRSSYEFELMWKGFGGNKNSQVRLLKAMDPASIPRVFKESLLAPLLLEIIESLELLFTEDAELSVQILENLTKVGRFNMTAMFLTSKERTGLGKLWDQSFTEAASPEQQERLRALRSLYRIV